MWKERKSGQGGREFSESMGSPEPSTTHSIQAFAQYVQEYGLTPYVQSSTTITSLGLSEEFFADTVIIDELDDIETLTS